MVIRHSLRLLEQLSNLELELHRWEVWANKQNLEIESETLLRLAWASFVEKKIGAPRSLTGTEKLS